ncbi:hypothetical protein BDV95DRAFT_481241 [Massariosphaeria phaeospora]|uniref:F-box domain-containing protein n=1 Tax=Massariosphaeria phaeospora TaxID=100035 RepID=A0A7C8MU26_9PLEO|nr:hypothetical protein BDV95DRAFT_481241 [Massariosphaeria phaeospora]
MDDLLPSYESAIRQDPWEYVAPCLRSDDLCSAALVCRKWHETFTPLLWGNPASHFGVQNDTVYVALTRFKRTLYWARLRVRELTHTLHLPPAHAEIYGGPHAEWLRDCLERLPRLQSLIVNGLPFFDHASLLTLRHSSLWGKSLRSNVYPTFSLRMLDASGCTNVTSTGLAEALSHFPDLVSLDLSRTPAAKDGTVFTKLQFLRSIRVLKLSGLGLKDGELSIIASCIGTRLRSLDVSENRLTDASARLLLDHCLKETTYETSQTRTTLPPVQNTRPLAELTIFGTEDLDNHLRQKLTGGFVGSLAIEDSADVGITHLYLSNNFLTVEGVSGLLRSKRLEVLDVGNLSGTLSQAHHPSTERFGGPTLPGVEKLTSTLAEYAAQKLAYLRINYKVITEDAPYDATPSPRVELYGDMGLYAPASAHEMENTEPPLPELSYSDAAVFELLADSEQPTELPGSSAPTLAEQSRDAKSLPSDLARTPAIEVEFDGPAIQRGPAYAPEPVNLDPVLSLLLDPSGGLSPMTETSNASTGKVQNSSLSSDDGQVGVSSRHNSAHYVEDRRARLELRQSQENRFHPGMLPKVRTLILTDVPTKTDSKALIDRLIQFIKDSAEESEIANLRARHTYILPPGRSRLVAEKEYASSLFALRHIVFEMAPPPVAPQKISSSWRQYPTKSSTEDADSEAFWEAATHDFSFFDEEECGLPNAEPGRGLPLAAMDGLMLDAREPAPPLKPRRGEDQIKPVFDVVSEIGKFREERKAAYNSLLQLGEAEPSLEGYWPGDITVVRKPVNTEAGSLDFYGNRFESGWLYR